MRLRYCCTLSLESGHEGFVLDHRPPPARLLLSKRCVRTRNDVFAGDQEAVENGGMRVDRQPRSSSINWSPKGVASHAERKEWKYAAHGTHNMIIGLYDMSKVPLGPVRSTAYSMAAQRKALTPRLFGWKTVSETMLPRWTWRLVRYYYSTPSHPRLVAARVLYWLVGQG